MSRIWTQEQRIEQAKRIRSWKPWQKSTGPKTIDGKKRTSQNAYKHGGRSQEFLYEAKRLKNAFNEYDRFLNGLTF